MGLQERPEALLGVAGQDVATIRAGEPRPGPGGLESSSPSSEGGRFSLGVLILVLVPLLLGCNAWKATKSLFGGNFPLEVTLTSNVNQESPIAVQLVVVYDKGTLEQLLTLSARDFFLQREQLARDLEGKADLSHHWEWVPWVPGSEGLEINVPYRLGANAAVFYADYYSPGHHRLLADIHKPLCLRFEENGFTAVPCR